MADDSSMDGYVAAREVAMPSTPSTQAPAAPPAQEPATSGPAEPAALAPAAPAAPSPNEPGAAPAALTPEQQRAREQRRTQERFDTLTRRALEAERRESMLLEAHRAVVAREQPQQPAKPAAPVDAPPREEDYPGDYRAFLRADSQYVARKEAEAANQRADDARTARETEQTQQREQHHAMRQVGEVLTQFDARKDTFAQEVTDYDAAIESLAEVEIGPHNAAMVQTLLMRPDSATVMYHLGKYPEVAAQISQLPPALQGAAVGEFAAYCKRTVQPSKAPPPGRPVGQRAPSSGGSPPASGSMEDYAAWRGRQTT